MAYCFEDCEQFSVSPILVASCGPDKCCDGHPLCFPCLPRCPAGQVVYCCEKRPSGQKRTPSRKQECCEDPQEDCCIEPKRQTNKRQNQGPSCCVPQESCCPTCHNPTCKPVKTKYVIPCYRYEDGRIEQYVPTRHGRLPVSAYSRNGMQDQLHGYRGAIRYICAGGPSRDETHVFTAVEPIRKIYPRITQEMLPVKRKKEKK